MIRLYTDENVDGKIINGLRRLNIYVQTVVEDGMDGKPDPQVIARAQELRCILFSMDQDMLRIADEFWSSGQSFYGVVYAPLGSPIEPCIESLHEIALSNKPERYALQVTFIPFPHTSN